VVKREAEDKEDTLLLAWVALSFSRRQLQILWRSCGSRTTSLRNWGVSV